MTALFFLLLIVVLLVATASAVTTLVMLAWYVLVGLVIGALARLLVKNTAGLGMLRTILAGIAGSIGGGLIADALEWRGLLQLILAVLVAAVVVAMLAGRRTR